MPQDESTERMEFLLSLRRRGIGSQAVLRAMDEVAREQFVPPDFKDQAYADQALPIACGQTISQPYIVAYMTEQLDVQPSHRVLEVGTGSGYQAAVLSKLAKSVVSVERYRTLAVAAEIRLQSLGCRNVTIVVGDGMNGVRRSAPYDRIMVTAAAESVPEELLAELTDGGILVMPVGPTNGPQRIVKLVKEGGEIVRHNLIAVRFVPLLSGCAREL